MKLNIILSFVTLELIADSTSALYFHIKEGERKCFTREFPEDTNVIVMYKAQLYDPSKGDVLTSSPGIGMYSIYVIARDPNGNVLSRVYSPEKNISFNSFSAGEHILCMYTDSITRFSKSEFRVHLDIQYGANAIDYAYVAQRNKLNEMELRIRQMLDQVNYITKDQKYQRQLKEKFRETSWSINSRILWICLLQTGVFVAIVYLQKQFYNSANIKYNSANTHGVFVVNNLQLELIHDGTPNDKVDSSKLLENGIRNDLNSSK